MDKSAFERSTAHPKFYAARELLRAITNS